ncbi:MAG: DEAD/DEAH box helicase family protein [Clostridia bacterium]|nr:DEAD/DEAH box helicase family protein [Clostridia bacterium]
MDGNEGLLEEIKEKFSIENYNLVQDEDNYYLFRALNNGDHNDMQSGVTRSNGGDLTHIRTDRARYVENPDNTEPLYEEDEEISIVQVIDHIKRGHRIDTNCISLSSNANVSIIYGNGYYHDEYVVIKVPKDRLREQVHNASEYMLMEMEKRIQDAVEMAEDDDISELIQRIDVAQSMDELMGIVSSTYRMPETSDETTMYSGPAGEAKRRAPLRSRFSRYPTLSEEQNLLKNKIIAKLTLLEERDIMDPIVSHNRFDTTAIRTLGMAISSSEILHYGDIQVLGENGKAQVYEVQKELMHCLGLLQQVVEKRPDLSNRAHQIENEIIRQIASGERVSMRAGSQDETVPTGLSVKQTYELCGGKLQYEDARDTFEKIFYLSKSAVGARKYGNLIDELTGNREENQEVIEAISTIALDVNPQLMDRKGKSEYKISESVSVPLMKYEDGLVQDIQSRTTNELEGVISNGVQSVDVINNLSRIQDEPVIPIDEYYARAIFNEYDWESNHIRFSQAHKEKLIKRLKERKISTIYEALKDAGIDESILPGIILNLIIADKDGDDRILESIEQGNVPDEITEKLNDENDELQAPIRADKIEDYLDFYKVEGTDIKLRDYQQSAINNIEKIFETHRFASVVFPTGAGKSFVAIAELLKQKAKSADGKVLYLAPSDEILEQIKKYAERYVHGEKLNKTREQIFKEVFPNVELATYQSLLTKSDEELRSMQYDYIILDELHRTGAEKWGEQLKKLLEAQADSTKVLGITATPERDVDNRNMADEMASLLGFSSEEIKSRKHIAKNMGLIDAIRLGIVVAPKIVECDYSLKNDHERWDSLLELINEMEEGPKKEEFERKYNELRSKVENAQGIPELFRDNIVKKDGRYIFYMPIGTNDYIEDEEGNIIGTKSGEEKVKQAQEQLREWLKYVDGEPEFYSMLGSYGKRRNTQELNAFEESSSEHVKVMIVMNKLNEGVHVRGINGIFWQRALDEQSRILLLQQLGRAIYSTKEGEEISEEDRPVVIDLPNNMSRVDLNKVINTYSEQEDIVILQNILDWIHDNDEILPDINSQFKEESRLAGELKRIQKRYSKYRNDNEFNKLENDVAENVSTILDMGSEIDLWDIELPNRIINKNGNKEINGEDEDIEDFIVEGVAKEFADFVNHIDEINSKNAVEKFIIKLSKLKGFGIDTSKIANRDTIRTLAEKSGIEEKEFEKMVNDGLELDDKIGATKANIAQAYRGNGDYTSPTEEQVRILRDEYGISLERQENATQIFIDKLKILKKYKIDTSKIADIDTIRTMAEKSGIEETEFEKMVNDGLKLEDKIGRTKANIGSAYRGTGKGAPPTEEQVRILKDEYGISLERQERENGTQIFIDKLKILKNMRN